MTLTEYRNKKRQEDITFYEQEIEHLETEIRRKERLLSFYQEVLRNLVIGEEYND